MMVKNPKRILVVDDDIVPRLRLCDLLLDAGYKVRGLQNGMELMDTISKDPEGVDLVLLDLMMPKMDGFEVLSWIKANGFLDMFSVLAITGAYDPATVICRLKELGAKGLITKNFGPEHVIFRVNKTLFSEKDIRGADPSGKRISASIPAQCISRSGTYDGKILNISETGTFLNTHVKLDIDEEVEIRFKLVESSDHMISLKGVVRWSTKDLGVDIRFGGHGIMFTQVSLLDRNLLIRFIDLEAKRIGLG